MRKAVSRRDFLKLSALGLAGAAVGLAFRPYQGRRRLLQLPDFPDSPRLGRVVGGKVDHGMILKPC